MNRVVLGAFAALLMVGVGLFWLQGRAEVEEAAPPPAPAITGPAADELPEADISGLRGPAPPEVTELTREEQRFNRYDRNRDSLISRNEMLSTRTSAFRALDKDGNNLLTFEEWAVTTATRFDGLDTNGDGILSRAEFARGAPTPRPSSTPACRC